jgi:hypothetical protein
MKKKHNYHHSCGNPKIFTMPQCPVEVYEIEYTPMMGMMLSTPSHGWLKTGTAFGIGWILH